jgi:hypothetical protein
MDRAVALGVAEALSAHKAAGNPVAVWDALRRRVVLVKL